MSDEAKLTLDDTVAMSRLYRLQWEEAQKCFVLLYPEGMVKLNQSSGEILRRVDGTGAIQKLVADLEATFNEKDLKADVLAFLEVAYANGWIRTAGG